MTLDAEVRALERTARERPDDGAAQVGLAAALSRVGRRREALEAFIRAAAAEPGDPEIVQALSKVDWWTGPRGGGGGTRALGATGARQLPTLTKARKLGQQGIGLSVGRGVVVVRVSDGAAEAHLEALALATGRFLWTCEEKATLLAWAPPLIVSDSVIDAVVFVDEDRGARLRVRAFSLATGKLLPWVTEQDLQVPPGATLACEIAAAAGNAVILGIVPNGQKVFEPLVKVFSAETGAVLESSGLRGLNELAFDGEILVLSAALDSARRIEARRLSSGERLWQAARNERTQRLAIAGDTVVAATDGALFALDRETGQPRWPQARRALGGTHDALVVTPRSVIGTWQREGTIALDLERGNTLWRDEPAAKLLAAAEDTLYAIGPDGLRLRALDLQDGSCLWEMDLGSLKTGVSLAAGVSKLACAPSRIVGLTKDGVVFILAGELPS